jgi:hypothetical protein
VTLSPMAIFPWILVPVVAAPVRLGDQGPPGGLDLSAGAGLGGSPGLPEPPLHPGTAHHLQRHPQAFSSLHLVLDLDRGEPEIHRYCDLHFQPDSRPSESVGRGPPLASPARCRPRSGATGTCRCSVSPRRASPAASGRPRCRYTDSRNGGRSRSPGGTQPWPPPIGPGSSGSTPRRYAPRPWGNPMERW